MENKFKFALQGKVIKSFKESIDDIMRGLSSLENNFEHKEFLDLDAREKILDAGNILEAAVYRSIVYGLDTKNIMQPKLQELNSAVNALAMKTNHEFFKTFNLKVVSLISLYIVYSI